MKRTDPREVVAALLPKLRSTRVKYFPIRHHSPACAAHVQRWIETHRPESILIEAPASFTDKIPQLLDTRVVCPVALFTTFIDKKSRLAEATPFGPPRSSAFYPFCDYSPELVALRVGQRFHATLKFIDLEYPEMVLVRPKPPQKKAPTIRVESLTQEQQLSHSAYVQALARKLGCRDANEVWDHLFESQWDSPDTEAFIDQVAAYCTMSRLSYTEEQLSSDDTHAREACMAWHIQQELARTTGNILVVTGGFHTVVLPDLVAKKVARPKKLDFTDEETGVWLTRYSFDQLDALAGYSAGMPHPAFYDRLWHVSTSAARPAEARQHATADLIVEVGRLTRLRGFVPAVTTPDAIAAVKMSRELASFRRHPWPTRSDVLDAMQSCFVKGEMTTEGVLIQRLVNQVLAGQRVGIVPPEAGQPPIVEDFYREAKRLKLPTDSIERRELALDLYRDARHRQISRWCHRLQLLGSAYANYVNGPDFVTGAGLERFLETWSVCWSPASESGLIESAVYGSSVEEAASNKLLAQVSQLQAAGAGRDTSAAVGFLVRACRLGVHRLTADLLAIIRQFLAEDPSFVSIVQGLTQLELLNRSREPLEAQQLAELPELMEAAYQRACFLTGELAKCPDELVDPIIQALVSLQETLAGMPTLDADLFRQPLERLVRTPDDQAQPPILGACAGLLYNEGLLPEHDLIKLANGFLGASVVDPRRSAGFLRGLLAASREVAWQVQGIMTALNERFSGWEEADFLKVLPELRLAFSSLTPREVARVADAVANLHGGQSLTGLVRNDLTEADALLAASLTRRVREALQADGLLASSSSANSQRSKAAPSV